MIQQPPPKVSLVEATGCLAPDLRHRSPVAVRGVRSTGESAKSAESDPNPYEIGEKVEAK